MFANPPEVKCAACGKEVFVSSAFPVKKYGKDKHLFVCSSCYDKIRKDGKK